jgi:integrase/recombinase XerD
MVTLRLRFTVSDKDRHGNIRYYFRRKGEKKVRLDGPPGSTEFMDAYQKALERAAVILNRMGIPESVGF